jgi:hypothetical protein
MKPRLLVLTDISSLTPRVREPDDGQSMVRLMLYSNEIDIEGLIASSNMGHGQVCRPELIRSVVNAYGEVRESLLRHHTGYPAVEQLLAGVHGGQPIAGPHTPIEDSIGAGKDSAASDWIQQVARRKDPRPLWVSIWGGTADLAQALWQLREQSTASQLAEIITGLRIHSVGDQDSTGLWIKANFPDLYYITRGFGIRGMYRGGETRLASAEWVETNIHSGHGALGAIYPKYDGGDIWSSLIGPVRGIKEGDTPSYLGLINNGLNPMSMPNWGSWGGRMQPDGNQVLRFVDAIDDSLPGTRTDQKPEMSATYRWRPAFQNDFAARLDWCVQDYQQANHAPRTAVSASLAAELEDGALQIELPSGEWLELDASSSRDPDGDRLAFQWWVYPEAGSYRDSLEIQGADQPTARIQGPVVSQPASLHVILTVTDSGQPPLSAYQRVILHLQP